MSISNICIVDALPDRAETFHKTLTTSGVPVSFCGNANNFLAFISSQSAHVTAFLFYDQLDISFEDLLNRLKNSGCQATFVCVSCLRSFGMQSNSDSIVGMDFIIYNDIDLKIEEVLTLQEKRILGMVGKGLPTKEIARTLELSLHTVNNHRKSIINKLGFRSGAELISTASIHSYVKNQKRNSNG